MKKDLLSVLSVTLAFFVFIALAGAHVENRELKRVQNYNTCQYFDFETMQEAADFERFALDQEAFSASHIEVIDFYTVGIYAPGCAMYDYIENNK